MNAKETYWSRFAQDFEARNAYVVGQKDIALISQHITEEKDLGNTLELACGNGTYSRLLAKNATHILATDFSQEMVSVSREKLSSFENIEVEQANAAKLSYPDNHFDTVFMANLLHIIHNPADVVKESTRVLKPGGKLMAVDFTGDGMGFFAKARMIYRYLKTYGKPPKGSSPLTLHDISDLMRRENLSIEKAFLAGNFSKAAYVVGKKPVSQ